jgi:nicotinamidase-related amidase
MISTQSRLFREREASRSSSPHLKKLRPFLAKGDFAPNSWGNALVDDLQPADLSVEKLAYSAFINSSRVAASEVGSAVA